MRGEHLPHGLNEQCLGFCRGDRFRQWRPTKARLARKQAWRAVQIANEGGLESTWRDLCIALCQSRPHLQPRLVRVR